MSCQASFTLNNDAGVPVIGVRCTQGVGHSGLHFCPATYKTQTGSLHLHFSWIEEVVAVPGQPPQLSVVPSGEAKVIPLGPTASEKRLNAMESTLEAIMNKLNDPYGFKGAPPLNIPLPPDEPKP